MPLQAQPQDALTPASALSHINRSVGSTHALKEPEDTKVEQLSIGDIRPMKPPITPDSKEILDGSHEKAQLLIALTNLENPFGQKKRILEQKQDFDVV